VGGFAEYLNDADTVLHEQIRHSEYPQLKVSDGSRLSHEDQSLMRYLFRDCKSVQLNMLDGGFSGNLVAGTKSIDNEGHEQVPHVVKIGPRDEVGKERESFEQIEAVLGNSAPSITGFADFGHRGAIKYRYASVNGTLSCSFQKLYMNGLEQDKVNRALDIIFDQQLGRFYQAGHLEKTNLMEYYEFSPQWASSVRALVEDLLGEPANHDYIHYENIGDCPNIACWYENTVGSLIPLADGMAWFSYLHGDLNGANIIVDDNENIWLIDFFHTHYGHVLKDLVKLENDLLYIFTPVESDADLKLACAITDTLMQVNDLVAPLPAPAEEVIDHPQYNRAWQTIVKLRSFYPDLIHTDRDPLQLYIAMMRYAVHTISFDECNDYQKKWALYTAGRCSQQLTERVRTRGVLRIDWLPEQYTQQGRLGMTILPGRRDRGRDLHQDIASMKEQGVSHVVCLLSHEEFQRYGVDRMLAEYRNANIELYHLPIIDQQATAVEQIDKVINWIDTALKSHARIMVHCVGGLGRSGMVAACYLVSQGMGANEAIKLVRTVRSSRAIETVEQERFVLSYGGKNE
jgi:protein-tyrosine phosphatase